MRLAFFSPLPPSPSGVAKYAASLLDRLMKSADVEIFVEDKRSRLFAPGWPIFLSDEFAERHRLRPFDRCVYQLGNNRLHLFAYHAALRHPGIVVLHDALLQHMLLGIGWDAWKEEFAYAY